MTAAGGAYIRGRYRYQLWRRWGTGHLCVWVMLNPSTADATTDDATIRKCMGFAKRWGFAGIEVVNLYALRSTDPRAMLGNAARIGEHNRVGSVSRGRGRGDINEHFIRTAVETNENAMCAWGNHAEPARATVVSDIRADGACYGVGSGCRITRRSTTLR